MNSSRLMKYFEQYVKNYDMNNINVERFLKIPKYKPYIMEDGWENILQ